MIVCGHQQCGHTRLVMATLFSQGDHSSTFLVKWSTYLFLSRSMEGEGEAIKSSEILLSHRDNPPSALYKSQTLRLFAADRRFIKVCLPASAIEIPPRASGQKLNVSSLL